MFAVNAARSCCKRAVPGIAARGGGAIVNVASVAALSGCATAPLRVEGRGRGADARSRSTMSATGFASTPSVPARSDSPWVRRLVDEVGESLDALRDRRPMGRLGTQDEIADAVLYLAAAEFVTGGARDRRRPDCSLTCRRSSRGRTSPGRPVSQTFPQATGDGVPCACWRSALYGRRPRDLPRALRCRTGERERARARPRGTRHDRARRSRLRPRGPRDRDGAALLPTLSRLLRGVSRLVPDGDYVEHRDHPAERLRT